MKTIFKCVNHGVAVTTLLGKIFQIGTVLLAQLYFFLHQVTMLLQQL